jgi:hypothetical protein
LIRHAPTYFNRTAVFSLISLGILLIAASAFYVSSFLTILGVSLTFWAAILFYITPKKHVQLDLLNSIGEAVTPNIERILSEYKLTKKGIYLPPKYLQSIESSLIFIPKTMDGCLPNPDENNQSLLAQEVEGIFIDPPGSTLMKFLERQLGTSFAAIDLTQLKIVLPKIFVEDLELAERFEIQTQDKIISIKITKSILNDICQKTCNQTQTYDQIGCILSSALACIIAKTTGKPVIIRTEDFNNNTKTTNITYQTREG